MRKKIKRQQTELGDLDTECELPNVNARIYLVCDEMSDDYKDVIQIAADNYAKKRQQNITPSKVIPYVVRTPRKRHLTPRKNSAVKSKRQVTMQQGLGTEFEVQNENSQINLVFDEISIVQKASDNYAKKRQKNVTPSKVIPCVVITPNKRTKKRLTPQKKSAVKNKCQLSESQELDTECELSKENAQNNLVFDEMSNEYKEFVKIASDKEVLDKLYKFKILYYFRLFFNLLKQGRYPLKNLALLLWLETVKWYSCGKLNEMRFWKTTKNFWRAGYRLFHGKFISFMSGPRCIGHFTSGTLPESTLDPSLSQINFAVPSRTQLMSDTKDTGIPKLLKPGVIPQAFKSIKNSRVNKINMMCMDGKKVTVGLDSNFGDVDMFGHEQSPTILEQAERLHREESLVNDLRNTADEIVSNPVKGTESGMLSKVPEVVDMLIALVYVLTLRLKEGRSLKLKQEYGLLKLKEKAGPDWQTSKFIFAISAVQAFLYRVKVFIKRTLTNIDNLCYIGSKLNGTNTYVRDNVIQCSQRNLYNLKPYHAQSQPVPSHFVPQRSPEWHIIRKQAPVTGSTMHNALGLRTLALQKKHFDVKILGMEEPEPSQEVRKFLEHGTDNEPNGIATLVGKFLPMFHPNLTYVEEGCYYIYSLSNNKKPLLAVSPDGSVRETHPTENDENIGYFRDCKAAIEIKCPYPKQNDITVYYSLPQYYVCQCLAEMRALDVQYMVFVCYTSESTTFFEVDYQEDLWNLLQEECEELYNTESLKRPVKKRPVTNTIQQKLKEFSENNVRLLVELPSINMSNIPISSSVSASPYLEKATVQTTSTADTGLEKPFTDLLGALTEALDCIKTGHQLSRKKASEVMVWVLSNKDRCWSPELPNSLIVAYGMKDYRLTSEQLRAATDDVLKECKDNEIHVPLIAFDGQWYHLLGRDGDGKPLTQLQVQKDVWTDITKLSKKAIVDKLVELNTVRLHQGINVSDSGIVVNKTESSLEVKSTDHAFDTVRTSTNPKHWKRTTAKEMGARNDEATRSELSNENAVWIPDDIIEAVEKSGDADLISTLNTISNDINKLMKTVNTDKDPDGSDTQQTDAMDNNMDTSTAGNTISLTDNDYVDVLNELLKGKRSEKWKKASSNTVKEMMSSATKLTAFTKAELVVVVEFFNSRFGAGCIEYKRSLSKEVIINSISKVLGNNTTVNLSNKRKKVLPLKRMAEKVLRGKTVPKQILNIAYAQYSFPGRFRQWQSHSPIGASAQISTDDNVYEVEWYSYPERNKATENNLYKTLDSHHLLTNLRTRTSTHGLKDISPDAWKRVASSFKTKLTPAMVEDLIDKQSNSFAQTHFSQDVENAMIENGDVKEAELCGLIRRWYQAEDEPALSVSERIQRWLALRSYLLEGVKFDVFPPQLQYVKGFSVVAFEGFLMGIDTKLQLFHEIGPYCVRTVSSLPAETAVGGIQDMNINKAMAVKAKDVPKIIASLTEVMTYKCDPDRYQNQSLCIYVRT